MAYVPEFDITPRMLSLVEEIAALRERILGAGIELSWIPALKKDTRARNVHASTAIEGNPLTLEQVRALEAGEELAGSTERSKREILNYFAGLRFVEKHAHKRRLTHEDVFKLHKILAGGGVMDQGEAGRYRDIRVRVGRYFPPPPEQVSGLMFELLEWWNAEVEKISPVLSSAIVHYRFESIHPFADGNGRTGRALALWELYRRGFDAHHIFSVDEYYWENRPAYYQALGDAQRSGENLTHWLEYCSEGLKQTLGQAWLRVKAIHRRGQIKIALRPKQEKLLNLLGNQEGMFPSEIWKALGVSKQGAMDLLHPLLKAGLVEKKGGKKSGQYMLKRLSGKN